jgi:hypothetical protein
MQRHSHRCKSDACKRSASRERATTFRAFEANPCVSPLALRHRKRIDLPAALPLIISLRQNAEESTAVIRPAVLLSCTLFG